MAKTPKRLGRGLSSLVSADLTQPSSGLSEVAHEGRKAVTPAPRGTNIVPDRAEVLTPPVAHRLLMVSVERIRRNPMQPRRHFEPDALAALSESIKTRGTLQPVIVRPVENGYELIAGERRLRAARLAGLSEMPAIVRQVPDHELLELALIENVQRSDLNPVERARAYQALNQKSGLSHAEIAKRMGEDRATVANYIRLLGLCDGVLEMVAQGVIAMGNARAILGVKDHKIQLQIARHVVDHGWSVRRTEAEVVRQRGPRPAPVAAIPKRPAVADMERRLSESLGTRVVIREGKRPQSGELVISYYNLDDFQRITRRLGVDGEET